MTTAEELRSQLPENAPTAARPPARYRRLRRAVVLSMLAVSLTPLILMTVITLIQNHRVFRNEAIQPIADLTSSTKRSLEFFLAERRSALSFIINDRSFTQLCDEVELARISANWNRSLSVAAFVDLGLIDAEGNQRCYTGPFELSGKSYADQNWFHEVLRRGVFISDVFLGHRHLPHFAIAIRHEFPDGRPYVLRATIDAKTLSEQIGPGDLPATVDVFLINRNAILQSPSRRYGNVLTPIPLPIRVPRASETVQIEEQLDERGERIIVGSTSIKESPYILMVISSTTDLMGSWYHLRTELLALLAVSAVLIVAVVLWSSNQFVNRLQEADHRRSTLLHQVEYNNKLASIGRLAAGVAHEINNPLAIINEKAGLLKDLIELSEDFPRKDKTLGLVQSVLRSVDRCSTITHRLLGFAKHMDVQHEEIDLPSLLKEVLSFLEKEASYRELDVAIDVAPSVPTVESDRGQLQQVFLNLLNNSFAAVSDGGQIRIIIRRAGPDTVSVAISDNGVGIPEDSLKKIFEPFFSTKEGSGTGLGLSITYGIVLKLGGRIDVDSTVGEGTTFTVVLPIRR